jgi:hypothetical protein
MEELYPQFSEVERDCENSVHTTRRESEEGARDVNRGRR